MYRVAQKHVQCVFERREIQSGVCEFTKLTRNLEAEYVKKSVGMRIQESNRYKRMLQAEGRRCWTLQYSESLNFHMDILPAIPFHKDYTTDRKLYDA